MAVAVAVAESAASAARVRRPHGEAAHRARVAAAVAEAGRRSDGSVDLVVAEAAVAAAGRLAARGGKYM